MMDENIFMKEKKPFMQATLEDTEPGNAEAAGRFLEESYEKA